jgi:general stress protein 26
MNRLMIILFVVSSTLAQEKVSLKTEQDSLLAAAREIIASQTYCALATIDSAGYPDVRTMNPFPPEEDMSIWMATNTRSRKVQEIRKNPNVCLYFANHSKATGNVTITGTAVLVTDSLEIQKRKREYWKQAFPDWRYLVLIKVIPERIEVLNYKWGRQNDPVTWVPPSVLMKKPQ